MLRHDGIEGVRVGFRLKYHNRNSVSLSPIRKYGLKQCLLSYMLFEKVLAVYLKQKTLTKPTSI